MSLSDTITFSASAFQRAMLSLDSSIFSLARFLSLAVKDSGYLHVNQESYPISMKSTHVNRSVSQRLQVRYTLLLDSDE